MRDIARERAEIDQEIAGKTLCSVFAATVARLGDQPALVCGDTRYTWRGYRERVRDVALGLRALGFAAGDFGVLLARNRPEHVIADLGILHAGGTPVSLYTTLAPEQIEYIAGHCEARVAFVDDAGFAARIDAVRARLPKLAHVVVLQGSAAGCLTLDDVADRGRAAHAAESGAFDAMWQRVTPEDTATLIYTSGTTGHPKGVIDTHRSVLWDITSLREVVATNEADHVISYLPLAHAADRVLSHYASLVAGHTIHFCPDLTQIAAMMVALRPTFFGAVPRIWEKLHAGITAGIAAEPDDKKRAMVMGALELARHVLALEQRGEPVPAELRAKRTAVEPVFAAIRAKIGLDRVKLTFTGAAPTPTEVLELFHAIGIPILEVWGMSELACIATINPPERPKIGSIGTAMPGVEAKIASDGELLARGGMTMRGYYKEPEKTAETIDADGWLATGDVATVDADGYFKIVDRKKELIITAGGKNISPANIESMLKFHPLIGQACVIGDNRAYLVALLVLDGQVAPAWAKQHGIAATSIAELAVHPAIHEELERAVAHVNEHVSRVENIRRWTVIPAEWTPESEELTPTLKLKRRVIRDKYGKLIESLYS